MIFLVARRHLTNRRRQTLLSVLSIFVGVTALITSMSMANGLTGEFMKRIMAFSSHLILLPADRGFFFNYREITGKLKNRPEVKETHVSIAGQALVEYQGMVAGVRLYGTETVLQFRSSSDNVVMKQGSFQPENKHTLVLGQALADALNLSPGAELTISSLDRKAQFTVTGIFESGMYDYDLGFAYTGLENAQWLHELPDVVTEIGVNLNDSEQSESIAGELADQFHCRVETFMERNRTFFSALKTEKIVVSLLVLFILVVAGIGIAGSLTLIVSEKKRDIGVLRTMGWSSRQIKHLFLLEGGLIGLLGTVLGTAAGWCLCRYLDVHLIQVPGEVYLLSTIPVTIHWPDILAVNLFAILCSLIAAYIPAKQAAGVSPAEVLHLE
ncbi:MAG: ABC transporter permease [bacterium]|nr:ABC transporter permease [bacterium]